MVTPQRGVDIPAYGHPSHNIDYSINTTNLDHSGPLLSYSIMIVRRPALENKCQDNLYHNKTIIRRPALETKCQDNLYHNRYFLLNISVIACPANSHDKLVQWGFSQASFGLNGQDCLNHQGPYLACLRSLHRVDLYHCCRHAQ